MYSNQHVKRNISELEAECFTGSFLTYKFTRYYALFAQHTYSEPLSC
jgi:hypothetical protein